MVEIKPQLSLLTYEYKGTEHVQDVVVDFLVGHFVRSLGNWFVLPYSELHQPGQQEMDGSHSELVDGIHVRLVVWVLEEELDVVEVDILRGHVDRGGEKLLVEMFSAGSGLQEG